MLARTNVCIFLPFSCIVLVMDVSVDASIELPPDIKLPIVLSVVSL